MNVNGNGRDVVRHYYNEIDPKAAAWLRALITAKLIPKGTVDERSITEVQPADLVGYVQCHFFAGVGGWPQALRLAGWPASRRVWTGSCPCQPFSSAGKRKGKEDERHLWPVWFDLIKKCKPEVVFGEQVSSKQVIGDNIAARKDMQRMLDQQDLIGVLRQQGWEMSELLQGVQQYEAEREEEERVSGNENDQEGTCTCCGRKVQGWENGDSIRSLRKGHPKQNRGRTLRTDGDGVRPISSQGLEHSITGSNKARSGVHKGQCESHSVCDECHVAHLGAEQSRRDSNGTNGEKEGAFQRFIRSNWDATPKDSSDWIAGVRTDLDSAGYSFGACVLAASSVGAPHIRQRLYWVANPANCGWSENGDGAESRERENKGPQHPSEFDSIGGLANSSSQRVRANRYTADARKAGSIEINRSERKRLRNDVVDADGLGIAILPGLEGHGHEPRRLAAGEAGSTATASTVSGVVNTTGTGQRSGQSRCDSKSRIVVAGAESRGNSFDTGAANHWSDFDLIPCRDGKTRRVGRRFCSVVDGLSSFLERLLPEQLSESKKEIASYAKMEKTRPSQAMCKMQQTYESEVLRGDTGGLQHICPPEILLAYMCKLNWSYQSSGSVQTGKEAAEEVLRIVRLQRATAGASPRRGHLQQCEKEPANSMHLLSCVLAQHAFKAWDEYRRENAMAIPPLTVSEPGRVAMLKGYGNAIVPQTAAEFIQAYMQTEHALTPSSPAACGG